MDKRALVPIAQGSEEMEAVIIIDILRRAGIKVTVVAQQDIVTCSRAVKLIPDILFRDFDGNEEFDAIILPGGYQGVENLLKIEILEELLIKQNESKKLIAAICAAPIVLANFKILVPNAKITCHPSVKNELANYKIMDEPVVVFGNILTSAGAGTAIDFALKIVSILTDSEKSSAISDAIIYNNF